MYSKLNELFQKNRLDIFVMAMSYIIDKGYETVKAITDDDIATIKGNSLMTEDFCKDLVKLAREICMTAENGIELYQFAMANELFDIEYFTNGEKYSADKLEEIIRLLLQYILFEDLPTFNSIQEAKDDIASYLVIDVADLNKLLEKY